MDSRTAEVKISRDSRPVIRRVLLGGVGCERGGRVEKSSDMLGEWRLVEGGVGIMVVMVCCCGSVGGWLFERWWLGREASKLCQQEEERGVIVS